MGAELSFPADLASIPPPKPKNLPFHPISFQSKAVAIPQIQVMAPPLTLPPSTPQEVPGSILLLIPFLYPIHSIVSYYQNFILDDPDAFTLPDIEQLSKTLAIPDTVVTREIFRHAQMGMPSSEAIRRLAVPLVQSSGKDPEKAVTQLKNNAEELEFVVAALNMLALSKIVQGAWSFALVVVPSAHFGYGAVEVKMSVYANDKLEEFHLYGIVEPSEDLAKLQGMLEAFSPTVWTKCLGVTATLTEEEHAGPFGIMTSAVIAMVARLIPKRRKMFTPDMRLGKRPPLMPTEVMREENLKSVIAEWKEVLDYEWEDDEIGMIEEDLKLVKNLLQEWVQATGTFEGLKGEGMEGFNGAWGFANSRFVRLRRFLGGIGTVWLESEKRPFGVATSSRMDIEIILQMIQVEKVARAAV